MKLLFTLVIAAVSLNPFVANAGQSSIQDILKQSDERVGESVVIANKLLMQERITSCQNIPVSGTVNLSITDPTAGVLSFVVEYGTGKNVIPTGLPSAASTYDKRLVISYAGSSLPVVVFEFHCAGGGGYALSTSLNGQLMEQHWNEAGTTKYRNTYVAQYNLDATLAPLKNGAATNSGAGFSYIDNPGANNIKLSTLIEYQHTSGTTTINATCQDGAGSSDCLYQNSNHIASGFSAVSMDTSGVLVTSPLGSLLTNAQSSHPYMTNINDYTWSKILNNAGSKAVSWAVSGDGFYYFDEMN